MNTLRNLINNVDRSIDNKCDIDFGVVCDSMNIDHYTLSSDIYEHEHTLPLKCYWLKKTLCTDTWVGIRVYVFNDDIVGYSNQCARKSTEFITWKNEKAKKCINDWLLTLVIRQEWDIEECFFDDEDNLDDITDDGYTLYYGSQLLEPCVLYNNVLCNVINTKMLDVSIIARKINNILKCKVPSNFDTITIQYAGHIIVLDISEILVPWNIL